MKGMNTLDQALMAILDGTEQSFKQQINNGLPKTENSAVPSVIEKQQSGPMTVMALGELVVVQDPVRFRNDIHNMVMAIMMSPLLSEDAVEEKIAKCTMIEAATVRQMRKASNGDLDSFKYMMDRILGKPVNQTNAVSMNITYEEMLKQLNPDEIIEAEDQFSGIDIGAATEPVIEDVEFAL